MAILDKAKATAERAREQATHSLQTSRTRLNAVQARRQYRRLLERLGETFYAEHRGEGDREAVGRVLAELDTHTQAHPGVAAAGTGQARQARDIMHPGAECITEDDTLAAGVAEVSVDRTNGKIKVHNVWCAIDAGIAVQPANVAAQTEGSIVYGLGHVLREKIVIKDGRVLQSNYTDYEVARMSDVPNIEVKVVSTDNPPTGAGEDGLPVLACAVGNAIAALTGVRLRELPFAPDRVRGALGA